MAEASSELEGPDFEEGYEAENVRDGDMLLGHAFGEPVLVARSGDDLFAIAATCTHYGGPLAKGLMVDCTVHCPWHHARFDLRTGEAIAAPALNNVASYKIEKRGERFFVTGKIDRKLQRKPKTSPASVVIIGAGAAGGAAAEMLRREGYDGPVTLIGADESLPCDRPNLSKDYLAGNAPEEWILLRPPEFYREQKIDALTNTTVRDVDPKAKQVTLSDGRSLGYGALLLATGAQPVHLTIPGADLPHVCYLRTLSDSRRIIEKAKGAKRAVVIGSSFIGLEVAWSLRERKLEVAVVGRDSVPLGKVLGTEMGNLVRETHEAHGVKFHLGRTPAAIHDRYVQLDDGTKLDCDLVVVGIGVRPNIRLLSKPASRLTTVCWSTSFWKRTFPEFLPRATLRAGPIRAPAGSVSNTGLWLSARVRLPPATSSAHASLSRSRHSSGAIISICTSTTSVMEAAAMTRVCPVI